MRAMKDSGVKWIGDIPEEWEITRTKYVASITNGADPKTEGDTPVYGSGDASFKSCGEYKEGPAVLIGRKGATLHIPHYVSGRYWNVDTAFDVKMTSDRFDLRYYYALATCFDYRYYTSTTTLPSMTQTNYGNMYLPCPALGEQKRIVEYLDAKCAEIDSLIAAKEKTNALLKERRQSIIYEAVTKGLDPTVPMKDSGVEWIGEIPEGWTPVRLKYCISRIESGTSVNSEDRPCNEKEKGVLKTSCVYSGIFQAEHNKAVLENEYPRLSCPVQKETVIVSRMNTPGLIGACGYVGRDYPNLFLPDRLWQVSFDTSCHPKYMWYFLSCDYTKSFFASVCNGTSGSMQNIAQDQFGSVVFFKPPYTEQISITNALDNQCTQIDELIIKNEVTIEELKEYRQSLIYEAVTGKIEVHHERRQS